MHCNENLLAMFPTNLFDFLAPKILDKKFSKNFAPACLSNNCLLYTSDAADE